MNLIWHSHSVVEIHLAAGKRLIIDPFLTGNPKAILAPEDVSVDYVLITHAHNDHIGDAEAICRANDALLISNVEIASFFADRGLKTHGLQPGGGFDFGDMYVYMTPAIHSSSYSFENQRIPLGLAGGFVIKSEDKVVYHAGDTALFSDMRLIGTQFKLDVAFLPIGDNYTMGPQQAVHAALYLQSKIVVPIHYNTFELIQQDPHKFVDSLTQSEGRVMKLGEELVI